MIIAGGCSFTDKDYQKFKMWPEVIGDMKNCEVINTAKTGDGNRAIFHKTLDAIQNNLDKVKHVYIMWTAFDRQDFLTQPIDWTTISISQNDWSYTFDKANKLYNRLLDRNFPNLKQIINTNLNYIFSMQSICESLNIKYTFCQAMPFLTGNQIRHFSNDHKTRSIITLSKQIIDHALTDKIKNFYGWPCISEIGGYNINDILDNEFGKKNWWVNIHMHDWHPDEKSNVFIASKLYDFSI